MTSTLSPLTFRQLFDWLDSLGQSHVLQYWKNLTIPEQEALRSQLGAIDFPELAELHAQGAELGINADRLERAETPPAVRLEEAREATTRRAAQEAADQVLAAGKLGAILVAGGQGTRLGLDHPKGMYPIGPVTQRSLFQIFADQLRAIRQRFGYPVPLYVMTSPATHDETVAFFGQHARWGLPASDVHFFCQGTMPAVDDEGRLLLEAPGRIACSPDGHGGMLKAWQTSGGLDDAVARGLEQIFYFQVDNPLVTIGDRQLLGFHLRAQADMSTLVVAKQSPLEKVGNVVMIDGQMCVIEYSDLPRAMAEKRDERGQLRFWAGSIAIHAFRLDFLRHMSAHPQSLPFHRARKKVPFLNAQGQLQQPATPNATKFERFIFDLMPSAQRALVVEGAASEVFAPLKNATGSPSDTPESTRAAITARAAAWIAAAGGHVARDVALEISPALALDVEEFCRRWHPVTTVATSMYLE